MNNGTSYRVRKARVFKNGILAGYLLASRRKFVYIYDRDYLANGGASVAIGLPRAKRIFYSRYLFPFFSGLLPEGENKAYICKKLRINPDDKFAMLVELAQHETIGNVTVQGAD